MVVSLQRPHVVLVVLVLYCLTGILAYPDPRQREALMQLEASMQTGGQMVLTEAEQQLEASLSLMKQKERMRADFPPAMHFFQARPLIRTSPIFGMLQKMPKGVVIRSFLHLALLHLLLWSGGSLLMSCWTA